MFRLSVKYFKEKKKSYLEREFNTNSQQLPCQQLIPSLVQDAGLGYSGI